MNFSPDEWFQTIRQEYLQRFIGQGGSSVKFVVTPTSEDCLATQTQLEAIAQEEGYGFVPVTAKDTKIHMMDRFFHHVAAQIPWDELATQFVRRLLQENGYRIPDDPKECCLAGIAKANERAEPLLRRDLNSWLERAIYRDTQMCQEFRMAMIRLCLGQLDTGAEAPFMIEPVKAWLRGELRQISALKEALIFQKIVRTNARYMFSSLSRWLRLVGKSGLVVSLDLSRCLITKKPEVPEGFYYGVSTTLDAYEMLRQFIDGTDELEGMLLVVLVPPEFLTDGRRGLNRYEALKLRIWDEVRDRQYQNPLGALIRLGSCAEGGNGNTPFHQSDRAAMANGDIRHQRAMEALRSGVPNQDVVEVLGSHQPEIEGKFRRFLQRMDAHIPLGTPTKGLVIEGGFGSGKSHLLKALQHIALEQQFVCSPIVISKETPLYNVVTLLRSAIANAVVPGKNGDALTEISSELNFQSPPYTEFFDWAHRNPQACDARLAATLFLYEKMVNDPELSHRLMRFWAGDPLSNSQLKKYLQGCGPEGGSYVFEKRSLQELALSRFQFLSRLIRAAGFKGWILLVDEAEIIGRYSFKQRTKSYGEIARWLGILEEYGCPEIGTVVALTDDFQSVMLEEKHDSEKIEQLCQLEGPDQELAVRARQGLRAIEEEGEMLIRPYDSFVDELYEKLHALHSSAYSWTPPQVSAVEKLSSTRMREYVRGWITEWDLRRLFPEAQLDIEILDVQQSYEEDQEFETGIGEESDGGPPTESEDPMLAVALENQAPV